MPSQHDDAAQPALRDQWHAEDRELVARQKHVRNLSDLALPRRRDAGTAMLGGPCRAGPWIVQADLRAAQPPQPRTQPSDDAQSIIVLLVRVDHHVVAGDDFARAGDDELEDLAGVERAGEGARGVKQRTELARVRFRGLGLACLADGEHLADIAYQLFQSRCEGLRVHAAEILAHGRIPLRAPVGTARLHPAIVCCMLERATVIWVTAAL